MPLLHCTRCHHEWEGSKQSLCDWCGGDSRVLEDETQFEKFVRYDLKRMLAKWKEREVDHMKNKP